MSVDLHLLVYAIYISGLSLTGFCKLVFIYIIEFNSLVNDRV